MSTSASVRAADLRAVFQLVGECRELGDDPMLWRMHFGAGLCRLVDGGWTLVAEIGLNGPHARRDLGTAVWGWENGFDRDGWLEMLAGFHHDPLYNPVLNGYVDRMPRCCGTCLSRPEMIADRDWYPTDYFRGPHRALGADAALACFQPVPGAVGEYTDLFVLRGYGERDFSGRDRAVVAGAMAAVAPLVGGPLARFGEPSPAELPPLARRVLRCLLEGDGDKQVAARLGIAKYTVNGYAKVIFRHFNVASRAELLARWVRRGWGSKFAWAEGV